MNPLNQEQLAQVLKQSINNNTKRFKYGQQAEKKFLEDFLGEKVFRKFMNAISI